MPMLKYFPERRATAQQMLYHPWLDMPADFEFLMNERDFEKMIMIKKNLKSEKREASGKSDLVESDIEINMGDDEDNFEGEDNNESEDIYPDPTETINIQNFNNSFAAYGQHVKLSALDRANPQFKAK